MVSKIFIAFKLLQSRKFSNLTYFNLYLSIIAITFSIVMIIISDSMINGYRNVLIKNIRNFNGLVMISNYNNKSFSENEISSINQLLGDIEGVDINRIIKLDSYIKKNRSIIPISIIGANINKLVNLGIVDSIYFNNNLKNHILLSENFLKKYRIFDDQVIIFHKDKNNLINIDLLNINGSFKSDFYPYSTNFGFCKLDPSNNKVLKNGKEYLLVHYDGNLDDKEVISQINHRLSKFPPVLFHSYLDMNQDLLSWLDIYGAPINLILLFILFISLVNLSFSIILNIKEHAATISFLRIIGYTKSNISATFSIQGILIVCISIFLGFIISNVLIITDSYYHLIHIPADIYFIPYIPLNLNFFNILYYLCYYIIIASLISYLTSRFYLRNNHVYYASKI